MIEAVSAPSKPLTMKQLLGSGVLGDCKVVAGGKGVNRAVSDVSVTARCDETIPVSADQLVILDGSALQPNSYALDIVLRAVRDGGGAGLVVVNAPSPAGLATRRLAERFETVLVESQVSDLLAMAAAARELLLQPVLHQATMMRQLLRGMARVSTVDDTLALVGRVLGRQCSLVEASGAAVAGPENAANPDVLGEQSVIHPQAGAGGEPGMVCPVIVVPGEPARFWLVCILSDGDEAVSGTGLDLLSVTSWAVGAHLVRDRLAGERDARHRLALLNEVVGGGELPDETILAQMATFGWSAAGWVTAFHVQLSGHVDAAWVLVNTDSLSDLLHSAGLEGPLIERTDGWSGWISLPEEPDVTSYPEMTRRLRSALDELIASPETIAAHAGVGRPAQGLPGLRSSLAESRQAAALAGAGVATRGAVVRHIDELGIQRIMLGWYGSADFSRVAAAFLEPLRAIDADGTLLRTLEVYLDCQSSATNAAALLGVHRNTVMNRIDRVASTLEVNLFDPEQRLALQLVVRMHKLDSNDQSRTL